MKHLIICLSIFISFESFSQIFAPISVSVTDYNKKVLQGEQVLFVNQKTKQTFKGISDAKGIFKLELPVGIYDIRLKSIGDAQEYSTLEVPKIGENQTYNEMEIQIMISTPKFFTLNNIHFATAQSTILKSSYKELNELFEYLKYKPNTRIEISGHTDSVGDEEANMALSLKRAKAVKQYLVKKGISASRLFVKGYGESRPIASNSTPDGKAKNRRTEVRIL